MPHGGTIISFPGQEVDEKIFVFLRRHPVAFLPTFLTILLMTILGIVMIFFLGIDARLNLLSDNGQILLGSAFLLFMMLFALAAFFDFYFDLNIVTDRRIIDIDQHMLFSRSMSELLLEDIQDVASKVTGILATFFDFGDVNIQTAGAKPNFTFSQVPHPREVAAIIVDLSEQQQRGVPIADRHPEGSVAAVVDGRIYPHSADHQNEIP